MEWQKYMNMLTEKQLILDKTVYTLNLCYCKNKICKQIQVIIIDQIDNKYLTVQSLHGEQFTLVKNENNYYSLLSNVKNNYELDRLAYKFINNNVTNMIPKSVNIHDANEIKESQKTVNFCYLSEFSMFFGNSHI